MRATTNLMILVFLALLTGCDGLAGLLDSDGDGVVNAEDAFPNDPNESADSDGDGIGDNADPFPDIVGCPEGFNDVNRDGSECIATFRVGGTVSGLSGTGLVLVNNGGETLAVDVNGGFSFGQTVDAGSGYDVSIGEQPTGQFCTVGMGQGNVSDADVTDIAVACTDFAVTGVPGDQSTTLTWSDVFAESYDVLYSTDEACDIADVVTCANGAELLDVSSPLAVTGLVNDTDYFISVRANGGTDANAFAQVTQRPTAPDPGDEPILIEITFSGDATESSGDIDYLPGETFSGRFVFDTTTTLDQADDPNVGLFTDSANSPGTSGLVFAEINTNRGTVSWSREDAVFVDALAAWRTQQLQFPNGQTLSASVSGFGGDSTGSPTGFSGAIDGLMPFSIAFDGASEGPNATFFIDPNLLLSNGGSFDLAEFTGARIIVAFTNGQDTTLAVGAAGDVFEIRAVRMDVSGDE